jgi:nucleoside-diphosphate kinase
LLDERAQNKAGTGPSLGRLAPSGFAIPLETLSLQAKAVSHGLPSILRQGVNHAGKQAPRSALLEGGGPACYEPRIPLSGTDPMALEQTFSILKPDATKRNLTGAVNAVIEKAGLRIVAQKRIQLTRKEAETFYGIHRERPFFGELVEFMTSGPVVVQVLEGENAVAKYRDVMGATNPANADEGTIRKQFAQSVGENTVHGSDSAENAKIEIAQFFSGNEIVG